MSEMKPLRLAIVLPHLGIYGGIRRFFELSRVWTARGHHVAILTPERAGAGAERDPWLPFEGERGGLERLRDGEWDVVLSPDPELFLRAEAPGAARLFYAVLEKAPRAEEAWRRADIVLANSTNMLRYLEKRGIFAIEAVGGVNLDFFMPPIPDRRMERAKDPQEPVRVLVYGRLSRKRKGSMAAARAVDAAFQASRRPVELTLFDSPPSGAPEPGPLPLRVPHRWVLRPSQEALADLYRDADIFVSAERRAGWCNTAAEAMACGAAVVCTPSGTLDFAHDGDTALVARWPWRWMLASRIQSLILDPHRRFQIASKGHRAIQFFGWERTATQIESVIRARLGADAAVPA